MNNDNIDTITKEQKNALIKDWVFQAEKTIKSIKKDVEEKNFILDFIERGEFSSMSVSELKGFVIKSIQEGEKEIEDYEKAIFDKQKQECCKCFEFSVNVKKIKGSEDTYICDDCFAKMN
ncbi:MAG: hypothetical protein HQK84_01445 [Nitrospinae bacterium]|nr:hypothetical protein [Nitrospinota bacterium]